MSSKSQCLDSKTLRFIGTRKDASAFRPSILFACRVWMQSNRRWLGSSALRPAIIRKFSIAGVVRRRGESAAHPSYGDLHLSTHHFNDQGLFPIESPLMARSVSRKVRGVEHAGQPFDAALSGLAHGRPRVRRGEWPELVEWPDGRAGETEARRMLEEEAGPKRKR